MWCKSCLQLAGEVDRNTVIEGIVVFLFSEVAALLTIVVYKSIEHVTMNSVELLCWDR